jgi:hypothetical protein
MRRSYCSNQPQCAGLQTALMIVMFMSLALALAPQEHTVYRFIQERVTIGYLIVPGRDVWCYIPCQSQHFLNQQLIDALSILSVDV